MLAELAAISALAVGLRVIFGGAALSTDPTYALVWGRDIIHGHAPEFGYPFAPTAHPLPTLESSLGALLGASAAVKLIVALSYWSVAALLWGVFRLGEALFTRPVALLAAALVGSNFATVNVLLSGFLDAQFLAIIVWAAVLEVREPRRGMAVMVLFAVAGLLRPEAWLIAAAYWLYACRGRDDRLALGLLVIAGPLAWVLIDLAATGDPVFAFSNARDTGESLQSVYRAHGTNLVSIGVGEVRTVVRIPVLIGGTVGLLLAACLRRASIRVPTALLGLVLLAYSAVLVLGLPLPDRMLLTPEVMLALFCAYALLAWRDLRPGRARALSATCAVAVLVPVLAIAPGEISSLAGLKRDQARVRQVIADLAALNRSRPARFTLAGCRSLSVSIPQLASYTAYHLDRPVGAISAVGGSKQARGTYLNLTPQAAVTMGYYPRATYVPHGVRRVAGNRSWNLYASSC